MTTHDNNAIDECNKTYLLDERDAHNGCMIKKCVFPSVSHSLSHGRSVCLSEFETYFCRHSVYVYYVYVRVYVCAYLTKSKALVVESHESILKSKLVCMKYTLV